jgi:outer membrane protein assembly factor BamE (lipoprotein component of BamABCDE complex)
MARHPGRRQFARVALGLACLAAGVAGAARAAPEPVRALTREQESRVRPGMTMDEVTAAIGKPLKVRRYGKVEATWGYLTGEHDVWFLVDFGRDGKVKLAKRQVMSAF